MTSTLRYRVRVVGEISDPLDDNVDVEVSFDDGKKYVLTFFTINNVHTIMSRHALSGESMGGNYFWCCDMIIVRRLDDVTIRGAIEDMLNRDCFFKAFSAIIQSNQREQSVGRETGMGRETGTS